MLRFVDLCVVRCSVLSCIELCVAGDARVPLICVKCRWFVLPSRRVVIDFCELHCFVFAPLICALACSDLFGAH